MVETVLVDQLDEAVEDILLPRLDHGRIGAMAFIQAGDVIDNSRDERGHGLAAVTLLLNHDAQRLYHAFHHFALMGFGLHIEVVEPAIECGW